MSYKNKVFQKLFETKEIELSKEAVELAGIKELTKANDKLLKELKAADKLWRDYQDYLTGADKPYRKMLDSRSGLLQAETELKNIINAVEKSAKELGVSPDSITIYKGAKQNLNTSNEIDSTISSFKDPSSFQ